MGFYLKRPSLQPRVAKKCSFPIPIQLIVVVAGILVCHFLELNTKFDVDITGPIHQGFPPPLRPTKVLIGQLWDDAIVVGLVGYSVTLSLAKKFGERFKYEIDGNQEILAEVGVLMLDPNVGQPVSVHILSFVQNLSTFCPIIVQLLTTFCLRPAFDYFLAQNCLLLSRFVPLIVLLSSTIPISVLFLSTCLTLIQAKSRRQKVFKS